MSIPTPAAGADWSVSPSSTDAVRIVGITGKLVTSATAGTRVPALQIKSQDGEIVYQAASNVGQAASLTDYWTWDPNYGSSGYAGLYGATVSINLNPMPELWLPYQWKVQTLTYNIAAGDQWSALFVMYEDPFDPSPSQVQQVADASS